MDDLDASRQSDGILRYRRDANGTHVGIIPATCKSCGGSLHQVGFRAAAARATRSAAVALHW